MSKQADIRAGIEMIIDKEINRGEAIGETWFHGDALSDLLSFLHSQGVVLKVDRELPELMFIKGYGYLQKHSAQALLDKAGCVAVESIK